MSLRLVKGLVVAMSVALVVGFVILMVGLGRNATQRGEALDAPPFRLALDLPDGAAIITITGAGDRLAVLVEHPDGHRDIHLVDAGNGRVTGIVTAD